MATLEELYKHYETLTDAKDKAGQVCKDLFTLTLETVLCFNI